MNAGKRLSAALKNLLTLPREERLAFAWSFCCFFSILCAYFLLRPVRDEMAILAGPENIPDLFLATFVAVMLLVPLFGWITQRYARRRFTPAIFLFCSANLLLFYWAFESEGIDPIWAARVFFVWLSVFNFFVVSLFWSFMADLYNKDQARRLFGMIAAGGSAGAIVGPLSTAALVQRYGFATLFLIATCLLLVTVIAIHRLLRWAKANAAANHAVNDTRPIGGSVLEGITLVFRSPYLAGIGSIILLGHFVGTALYVYQAQLLSEHISDSATRTELLATMDVAINVLTLFLQFGVARYAIRRIGVGKTLLLLPALSIVGFLAVALAPSVALLVVFQVLRRATNFGLNNPARETLFTVVSPQSKYKAKNFLDVAVVRTSDVISAQSVRLLQSLGLQFGIIAAMCAGLAAVWAVVALAIGRRYHILYSEAGEHPEEQAR